MVDVPFRRVGLGPVALPGERRRLRRLEAETRQLVGLDAGDLAPKVQRTIDDRVPGGPPRLETLPTQGVIGSPEPQEADAEDRRFMAMLRAAGAGEHWALAQLFRTYQPQVLLYLRNHEPSAADDLASEVWVAVARGLSRFEGDESSFRGWLFTICKYRVIEYRQRASRRGSRSSVAPSVGERAVDVVEVDSSQLDLDEFGDLDAEDAVDRLVSELTPDQAEAVRLRVIGGLSNAEVAAVMDRSASSVRILTHRAMKRLAVRFEQMRVGSGQTSSVAASQFLTELQLGTPRPAAERSLDLDLFWQGVLTIEHPPQWALEVTDLILSARSLGPDDVSPEQEMKLVGRMETALLAGESS